MIKILLKITLIFFLLVAHSLAEIIKKVEVIGNKRISNESVVVLGDIPINKEFTNEIINFSLKKLYETNFFKDVEINFLDGVLLIKVEENPIIENIEIIGIKNKTLLKNLYDEMKLKNRMSYTKNNFLNDVKLINNIFKSNGFYFAKIETFITVNDDLNSVQIKLEIDKGEQAKIKEIVFIGDKKIKDKKLLEVIASEEHKFWKFISSKVYLNAGLISLDKRLLKNYYKNEGYYNIKIQESFAEYNDKGFFKLVFNVDAGEKFYFNDLKISVPEDYNISDFSKIEKIFDKITGETYSLDKINQILNEIDRIASSRLYDFINAEVDETIENKNKLNFNFKIIDSEKFYVEKINILNNFITIEEVIRNKLIVDEGDPFNKLLFNKSLDNIKSLGIFKQVKADIAEGSDPNLKIINLSVEEQPTGELSLAAGIGTSGSTIGGGVREKNFLGKGINLDTNLEVSQDSISGVFIYSKPNFAYTDNTLFTSVKSTTNDFLSDFGYKVSNIGLAVGTTFEQYENLFFSPEIDFALEELRTNTNASSNLKKQEGSYEDLYFNYSLDYDLRNSSYRPSSGNKTSFYQKLPAVSANQELENTFTFTQYKTLNKSSKAVGRASIYLKNINSVDGSDVRISKRAVVPYNRLRGFEKGKVGPIDNGDFIGGNYVGTLNLSADLPSLLPTIENVDFAYFIDFANVWGVDYDSSIDQSNMLRSSTGIGMNFLTPVGPLSFSLTQPISFKSSDKTETFRFNLGTTF